VAGIANVTIKIGAQTADAVAGIERVNKALGDQMTTSQKASQAIKSAAVPAAAAFAAVGAAALSFTKAAAEDADAQTALAGALKRTTGASDAAVKGAEDYIDSLSQQVAIADDELRPALAKLAAATGSVTTGQKQLALAADIAAQAHVPLATATAALVKADQGRYAGLQKLVPGIDAATIASKDQAAILEETSKLTAGAATEAASTFSGQQKALEIQMGETQEAIGKGFLPVLTALLPIVKKVSDFISDNTSAVRLLMIAVLAISGAVLGLNIAMKAYEAVSLIVKAATTAWTAVQWLLNAALNANPIGLVVIAVAALAAGIVLAYKHSDTFRDAVNDLWDAVKKYGLYLTPLGAAIAAVRLAMEAAQRVLESNIGAAAVNTFKGVLDTLKGTVDAVKGAFVTLVGYLNSSVTTAFTAIQGIIGTVTGAIQTLVTWVKSLIEQLGKIKVPSIHLPHIPHPFGLAAPTGRSGFAYAGGLASPALASRSRTAVAAGGVTINVYGAVDPEGTARAVRKILDGHDRRQGRSAG